MILGSKGISVYLRFANFSFYFFLPSLNFERKNVRQSVYKKICHNNKNKIVLSLLDNVTGNLQLKISGGYERRFPKTIFADFTVSKMQKLQWIGQYYFDHYSTNLLMFNKLISKYLVILNSLKNNYNN